MISAGQAALLVGAGLGAGIVNGAAGGGTLVSFPALLATGLPALRANITSTVGILPGYAGGVAGFRAELRTQGDRAIPLAGSALVGAAIGSVLLLTTPSSTFTRITPYLVLAACALFAGQPLVRGVVAGHSGDAHGAAPSRARLVIARAGVLVGSVYGGYFGAGLGVVLLALLGLVLPDDLVRTNGLRSALSLVSNIAAAAIFAIHGAIAWLDVGCIAPACLIGGYVGSRTARRLPPVVFRVVVISLGLATAIKLFVG